MNDTRLCLIEDDRTIRELVGEKLGRRGYAVDSFDSADPLMAKISAGETLPWELFVVDIMLRGHHSGLDLCRALRGLSATMPILILSALSEPADRVEGLRSGADDYLTKPFEMEELLLRVDGMLKRRSWYRTLPHNLSVFTWGDNSVDFLKLEGTSRGKTFPLTQKEGMLMKLLIEKEGQVVSRDEILDRVWGYDVYPSTRTVDNFVLRLRRHFGPDFIHSVRGLGYKFTR